MDEKLTFKSGAIPLDYSPFGAPRQPPTTISLDEAIRRLHNSVARRERDRLVKRYPFKGSERTKQITRRILGERDD